MIVSREVHAEGEPGYRVYVLLSGEVNIVTYANGKEHLISSAEVRVTFIAPPPAVDRKDKKRYPTGQVTTLNPGSAR